MVIFPGERLPGDAEDGPAIRAGAALRDRCGRCRLPAGAGHAARRRRPRPEGYRP